MKLCPEILRQIDHRNDLGDFLNKSDLLGMGVEVGTFTGGYAKEILAQWKGSELYLIDPYRRFSKDVYFDSTQDRDQDQVFLEAQRNLAQFGSRAKFIRKTSAEAVEMFEDGSLAFAYLDANHSFEATTFDINAWWPKLRCGGILGVHDTNTRQRDTNSDALNAILDFAEKLDVRPHVCWCTSSFFLKP